MIAAVCTWHEHHRAAAREIEDRLERGGRLVVPAPAVVECYAVLTRLPPPHRLATGDAWVLLDANFVRRRSIVALAGATYAQLVRQLAREAIGGGRTYDAVIAECARQGKASVLLTFNVRHFEPAPAGLSIVEPALQR